MKNLSVILMSICFLSCSKNYLFKRDQVSISNELKVMVFTDQAVRKQNAVLEREYKIRTPSSVWDSLIVTGARDLNAIDVSKLPSVSSQLQKMPMEVKKQFEKKVKESKKLVFITDSIHANKIYNILHKYGYPSYYSRTWKSDSLKEGITAVLTHINHQSIVGKKIKRLMIKEYHAKRVSDGEMKHYLWDVDGRKDGSFGKNIDVNKWIKNNSSE